MEIHPIPYCDTTLTVPLDGYKTVRVCAEAAAAGTPILTVLYPSNGTVNVVSQYGIGWISNSNLDEFSEKIERYGNMKYWEWDTVSNHCKDVAQKIFDWEVVAHKFLEIAGVRN